MLQFLRHLLAQGIGAVGLAGFDVHREMIEVALAGDFELVMGRQAGHLEDHLLDLRREYIDAADDHHVVAAPGDLVHAAHGPRRARQQAGEIAGAVADDRHGFLDQGGEDQLAFLAVGQGLEAFHIDDLRVEVILPDGGAVLGLDAFLGHAGADDLGQAVDVHGVDAETRLDFLAHGIGPGLGAEDADAQRTGRGIDALALEFVGDVEAVGGRHHDDVGLEVADQLNLLLGLAAGHRDYRAAEPLGAVVSAQPSGEQAVAVGHMHLVAGRAAGGADRTRHDVGPAVDVALGIADHGGLSGGAAGGMHAHHIAHRHGETVEGVGVAQILLGGVGEQADVFEAFQVGGMYAGLVELAAIHRHIVVGVIQGPFQALQLQGLQFVLTGFLDGFQLDAGRVEAHDGFLGGCSDFRSFIVDSTGPRNQTRSMTVAMPWPTPMHMVHRA